MAEALEGLIDRLEALTHGSATQPVGTVEWCGAVCSTMEEAAQALHLLGEAEKALEEIADGKLPPDQHGHYLAHRKCVSVARAALDKIRKGMGR